MRGGDSHDDVADGAEFEQQDAGHTFIRVREIFALDFCTLYVNNVQRG
jgi:hypothetical protein